LWVKSRTCPWMQRLTRFNSKNESPKAAWAHSLVKAAPSVTIIATGNHHLMHRTPGPARVVFPVNRHRPISDASENEHAGVTISPGQAAEQSVPVVGRQDWIRTLQDIKCDSPYRSNAVRAWPGCARQASAGRRTDARSTSARGRRITIPG